MAFSDCGIGLICNSCIRSVRFRVQGGCIRQDIRHKPYAMRITNHCKANAKQRTGKGV